MERLGVLSSGLQESLEVLSDIVSTDPTKIPSFALQRLQTELDATEQLRAELVSFHSKVCDSPIPMLLRSEFLIIIPEYCIQLDFRRTYRTTTSPGAYSQTAGSSQHISR